MIRQKFDIGDYVEYKDYVGLILAREAINPLYNTERKFHVDEYKCKILFLNAPSEAPKWVRAKWLKLISKSS